MKVVILAGGLGSRLSEYTKVLPKPMVKVLGTPIIVRIIKHYHKYGFKDFLVASGYKSKIIEKYFKKSQNLRIKVINTGLKTMTGGRVKRLAEILNKESFYLLMAMVSQMLILKT